MRRRQLLIAGLALPVIPRLAAAQHNENAADAIVSLDPSARFATSVFTSIAAALAAAPARSPKPHRIRIDDGVWREKLVVDKPNIHLLGRGRERSSIRFDAAAGQLDPQGRPWGTWGCASVRVRAPGFFASGLGFLNGFDYLGHLREPQLETIGSNGAQAVALMLDHGSDMARIHDCSIVGHQDTLFADAGRSFFEGCEISGSVDFIFGAGQALFERCNLLSRFRPGKERQGYIAAPSTLSSSAYGLVFHRCRLNHESGVPAGSVALGRAWRPTRVFPEGRYGDPEAVGAATFIECEMADHIADNGWDAMKYTAIDGSRVELQPAQARLSEYLNRGPGAKANAERPQLSRQQARAIVKDADSAWPHAESLVPEGAR